MECDGPRIDRLVQGALKAFTDDFTHAQWWGKEHDCVNRFVHGFLVPRGLASGVLTHPTQVGIEVGVAQPSGFTRGAACTQRCGYLAGAVDELLERILPAGKHTHRRLGVEACTNARLIEMPRS